MRHTRTMKLLLFTFLVVGCSLSFNRGKALAINNNGGTIPTVIRNKYELAGPCPGTPPFNYAQDSWISRVADTTNLNPITISQGTNSVNLWYNMLSTVCNNNITTPVYPSGTIITKDKAYTRYRVTGINSDAGTSVTDITGQAIDLNTQSYNEAYFTNSRYIVMPLASGFTFPNHADITLNGLGGLSPGLHTVHVNATYRPIHQTTNGNFYCVVLVTFLGVPGVVQPASSLDDPACQQYLDTITVVIDVQPNLPNLTIGDTCTGVSLSTNGSDVHVYNGATILGGVGGPSGNFTLDNLVSPGTLLDFYAIGGNGTPTAGNYHVAHVWTPPPNCSIPFTVSAVAGGVTLDGPDEDSPTGISVKPSTHVTFTGPGTYTQVRAGGGTTPKVQRTYTVTKANGTVTTLTAVPGDTFTGDLPEDQDYTDSKTISGLAPGDRICVKIDASPPAGSISPSEVILTATTGVSTDTGCVTVASKPYVSFYGNDILAGAGFRSGISCPAGIGDIDVPSNPLAVKGSSVQFAATAINSISGIISASTRTSTPTKPNGLTFANVPGVAGFGGTAGCIPDYYAAISANGGTLVSPPNLGPLTVGIGEHKAYFATGDLYINGDIKFQTNAGGGWDSRNDIPSLYIVARGNIYIGSNVHQLDGVYIAQPNGATGGLIDTCSRTPAFTLDELYGSCNSQLVVNGSFIAKKVSFLRTANSLKDAVSGESAATSKAAEVFRFSPETYLAIPPDSIKTVLSAPTSRYDYFTNLPPAL